MSAALVDLLNAVNTNTLTALQQAALSQALTAIIPTFPTPDELANAMPPPDEDNAREWIAALYAIQAEGSGGGPPVPGTPTAILNFPDIASLAAFNVVIPNALLQGQQAFVESNGSWWSLIGSAEPVDGITIINATGSAPAQWLRENVSGYLAGYLLQPAWFVDAQNISGNASDENTGEDAFNPLLSKAEIFRRWGYTWSPSLQGIEVTITYLSADTGSTDPGLFAPYLLDGAHLIETSPLPATSFTGTLLAVTPKNRAGNAALSSTFTTATGAMAANLMLVNTTRGNSRAFVEKSLGGAAWQISQPYTPYVAPGQPTNTEVDTWANGDALLGYALNPIDLPVIGGTMGGYDSSFDGGHVVTQLAILDPQGEGVNNCFIDCASSPVVADVLCLRVPVVGPAPASLFGNFQNFAVQAAAFVSLLSVGAGTAQFQGGFLNCPASIALASCVVGGDIIIDGPVVFSSAGLSVGVFYGAGATTIECLGDTEIQGPQYGVGGPFEAINARVNYGGQPSAVAAFPLTGGLAIAANGNAYGVHTAAGAVTTFNRALTPAALDAASTGLPADGFGGLAFVPGVGSFQNGNLQP